METTFKVTDFNNNDLGVFKSINKAYDFAVSKIGNNDSWISCPESNYNKKLKTNYTNVVNRIRKTGKAFIDSSEAMIEISK